MTEQPRISVELEPGHYIVSVHPAHAPRVWRIKPDGTISGKGKRWRRIAVWDALRDLTIEAEQIEGIWPG